MEGQPIQSPIPPDAAAAMFGPTPVSPQVTPGTPTDVPTPVPATQPTPEPAAATPAPDPIQDILNKAAQPAAPAPNPEIDTLRQQLAELQSKQSQQATHPLAQQINTLLQNGKTLAEVQKFVHVQSLDVNAMTDIDAVRQEAMLKYPTFTPGEIDLVLSNSGIDPDDLTEPKVALQLKLKAMDARTFLSQQKVEVVPNAAAVAQTAAQDAQALIDAQRWGQTVPQVIDLVKKAEFAFPVEGAGNYTFGHEYSPEAQAKVQQFLSQQAVPLTQEGIAQARETAEVMLFAIEGQAIMKKIVEDTWRSAELHFAKKNAGPAPTPPKNLAPSGGATPNPARSEISHLFPPKQPQ